MIVRSEELQNVCKKILLAVDTTENVKTTEILELNVVGNVLRLSVTNKEYYVVVKLPFSEDEGEIEAEKNFRATVNAKIFLKLISQITTESIEFIADENCLNVIGNGSYKIPLIFENDVMMEVPKIIINNVTSEFDINGDTLKSILNYNSNELKNAGSYNPLQQMYYIDEQGAITFTAGACVNMFNLPKPVKLLLDGKLVKLFKLFRGNSVHFSMGYDGSDATGMQTKIQFETDDICITSLMTNDEALFSAVPAIAIRERALDIYPYSVVIDRKSLISTISRLELFATSVSGMMQNACVMEFTDDRLVMYDANKGNREEVYYTNEPGNTIDYTVRIDLNSFKLTINNCTEEFITINFGKSNALVVVRNNVYNMVRVEGTDE